MLRAPFAALEIPGYAEDGGEEAEIAAIYMIASDGTPWRIGMAAGNEFSDHVFERRNYLNLAGSKLRSCSLGPELVINAAFEDVSGRVRIWRGEKLLWERRSAPVNATCATASPIWSIITSSLTVTASRARCMFTSWARTACHSERASACSTGI